MNLLTSSTSPRGRATLRRTVCDFLCFFIAHIVTHHAVAFLIDPHSVQAIITGIKQTGRGTEFICEKIFSQMNLQSVSDAGKFICEKDRKSTRLNSSHDQISYAVFCLKKKYER